ncbi:cell division protein FtsZ [Thioalkalivibrio sp. HK1]|uniref:cell division protein FtsZ n=1 Tax=Thioalkalivibrio sp. HK1 TaxID=1469245 RepID=UPI00046EE597|nr:cell division protein FtsZ [Thioalkalivibrio sp. HK1]
MFELADTSTNNAVIRVIGVGGGGGNAVEHMITKNVEGVEFVCANTDSQALKKSTARTLIQLGADVTKGLGAGANPEVGREAAMEDRERIKELLAGSDMLFITAGMGGGTGTGASPVIAALAREMGILTVAVVTRPFPFERNRRIRIADDGIRELAQNVDSMITIPNERLLKVLGDKVTLVDAFAAANDVLCGAVQGIADLITHTGMVNVDFADVRTVMSEKGPAMMGSGRASGPDRASQATDAAVRCPLLEDIDLSGARGILVNISARDDLSIQELNLVGDTIGEFASEDAMVIVGATLDESMGEDIAVTVVATGLSEPGQKFRQGMRLVGSSSATTNREAAGSVDDEESIQEMPQDDQRSTASDAYQRSYREYDEPTYIRQDSSGYDTKSRGDARDMINIPDFLRRQAD